MNSLLSPPRGGILVSTPVSLPAGVMALKLFLSYRRDETDDVTRSLYDRLARAFGRWNIFRDVSDIEYGKDFHKAIDHKLGRAHVLIAVIGRDWVTILQHRQAARETDWVRHELERAFELGVTVIPVLVQGAGMPPKGILPDGLLALATDNAIEVQGGRRFEDDVQRLIASLRQIDPTRAKFWEQSEGRVRGRRAAIAALASVGLLAAWREAWPIPKRDGRALGHLLYDTCWITYDPPSMDLRPDRSPLFPGEDAIESDLDAIAAAGFNGVVTSTANGIMDRVPRLAQARGLRAIMGIWNPNEATEVTRAIRQEPYVDAYCVGHAGLLDRYSLDQLERAVDRVRRRTGKPAAVSELAIHYAPDLARLGDWLFPDAHLTIRDGEDGDRADVGRDLERFMEATRTVAPLAQRFGKPLVFANVAYPHGGIPGASRTVQAEFFRRLLERINDPGRGHAVKVAIVPQTAFDAPWKRGKPFLPWDPHAGLIDADEPRDRTPAARAILRWFPHLEAKADAASR